MDSQEDTVSVFELEHRVLPKALNEGRKADDSFKKHDMAGYIDHVRKALAIDPDYLVAHRNLAVVYIMSGDFDKAVGELGEVLKRDPRSVLGHSALSCAYLQMNRYAESEASARRALDLDPGNVASRYYLGVSLAIQKKNNAEALDDLQKSVEQFPKAHIARAQILERLGMKLAAKGELEEYLASGDQDVRAQVTKWLSAWQ